MTSIHFMMISHITHLVINFIKSRWGSKREESLLTFFSSAYLVNWLKIPARLHTHHPHFPWDNIAILLMYPLPQSNQSLTVFTMICWYHFIILLIQSGFAPFISRYTPIVARITVCRNIVEWLTHWVVYEQHLIYFLFHFIYESITTEQLRNILVSKYSDIISFPTTLPITNFYNDFVPKDFIPILPCLLLSRFLRHSLSSDRSHRW